jgi:hypothetical protein
VFVLEPQQMLAQRRLVQNGRITAGARRQLAHHAQIFLLGSGRQPAQFEQFRKADQRFRIGYQGRADASPLRRGMGGNGASSLASPLRSTMLHSHALSPPHHYRTPPPRSGLVHL